jgi:hypothetical protein
MEREIEVLRVEKTAYEAERSNFIKTKLELGQSNSQLTELNNFLPQLAFLKQDSADLKALKTEHDTLKQESEEMRVKLEGISKEKKSM